MSARTLAATGFGFGFVLASVLVAACGGKIDGASSSGGSSGAFADPTPSLPPPSSGRPSRPGRPTTVTAAALASEIAETYCKAFSNCCVGTGQPPIDVARCRQLVTAEVEASVAPDAALYPEDVATCVATIKGRVGVCSAVDGPWWASSTSALLAPATVMQACSPILGIEQRPATICTSDASCIGLAARCAVDQCVSAGPLDAKCGKTADCLDGLVCIASTCSASPDVTPKGACTSDDECRLGLVCAKGLCLPSREFPELASPRFSPYRVGADTCRAYSFL